MATGLNGASVLLLIDVSTTATPDFRILAGQRGADINRTADLIDASSKDRKAAQFLSGRINETISLESLYVPGSAALEALDRAFETGLQILVRINEFGNDIKEGTCFVTNLSRTAPDQDVALVNIELQISGGLRPATI